LEKLKNTGGPIGSKGGGRRVDSPRKGVHCSSEKGLNHFQERGTRLDQMTRAASETYPWWEGQVRTWEKKKKKKNSLGKGGRGGGAPGSLQKELVLQKAHLASLLVSRRKPAREGVLERTFPEGPSQAVW